MKTQAISGLPVSVTIYTETGLADPQKASPKQRTSSINADTKANQSTYAAYQIEIFDRHSTQPADLNLFRRARHTVIAIVHAVHFWQPQAGRISQARPALTPV